MTGQCRFSVNVTRAERGEFEREFRSKLNARAHRGTDPLRYQNKRSINSRTRRSMSSMIGVDDGRRLSFRILNRPVIAPRTRHHRALIAAAHRDQPVRRRRELGRELLRHLRRTRRCRGRCIASTTSGCTRAAGCVPAEIARAFDRSTCLLKRAAAICDRPALCTQAKRTVITTARRSATRVGGACSATCSRFSSLTRDRGVRQRMQRRLDHRGDHRVGDRRQTIVHPDAVAARLDQSGLPQIGEMPRRGRLRHVQAGVDVAHADLIFTEQRQDPQARRIGERRVDAGQRVEVLDIRRRLGRAAGA